MFHFFGARFLAPSQAVLTLGLMLAALTYSQGAAAQAVTLSDALTRAADYDPAAPASSARIQAAKSGVDQAGMSPNPVLGVEVEDFSGSGRYARFGQSQVTLYYEEMWERGGKREARTDVASAELALAQGRGTLKVLDLAAQVQAAWVEALAAQAAIASAEERFTVAQQLEREVARRAAHALDPVYVRERMRTGVAQARIARDQAMEAARIARIALAAHWGGNADFTLEQTPFALLDTEERPLSYSPDLTILAAERDAATARVGFEKARAVQDPTLRAGIRRFSDGNDVAVVFGVSIPLAFHDTNRGNIARAQSERLAAEVDIAAARIEREREIARLARARSAMANEIKAINAEILPSAERAVALVRDGFKRGGTAFSLLEVTEAQDVLIGARSRRIELLRRFHLEGARLDRLTGRHLSIISAENRS